MGKEFEIKFAATPAQLAALEAAFQPLTPISMETTYYDALDGSLSARHITLRRRMENGISVCTVKTPLDGLGRGEWDTECSRIEEAVPVLCKLCCTEDLPLLTRSGIVEVCGARFLRKCATLHSHGCTLELALDEGVLLGGSQEIPLCEVEVELKEGNEEDALLFARILAAKYGLKQENRSKFRRALALAKEG